MDCEGAHPLKLLVTVYGAAGMLGGEGGCEEAVAPSYRKTGFYPQKRVPWHQLFGKTAHGGCFEEGGGGPSRVGTRCWGLFWGWARWAWLQVAWSSGPGGMGAATRASRRRRRQYYAGPKEPGALSGRCSQTTHKSGRARRAASEGEWVEAEWRLQEEWRRERRRRRAR